MAESHRSSDERREDCGDRHRGREEEHVLPQRHPSQQRQRGSNDEFVAGVQAHDTLAREEHHRAEHQRDQRRELEALWANQTRMKLREMAASDAAVRKIVERSIGL